MSVMSAVTSAPAAAAAPALPDHGGATVDMSRAQSHDTRCPRHVGLPDARRRAQFPVLAVNKGA